MNIDMHVKNIQNESLIRPPIYKLPIQAYSQTIIVRNMNISI